MAILVGFISGIITAIGMGGGTILILLLTLFLKINQYEAQAVNLIFFIPTAITASIINFKNKKIDFKIGIKIIIFGILGAVIGAFISTKIDIHNLRVIFGLFLFFIAIHEIYNFYNQYIKFKNTHTKNVEKKEVKNYEND